MPAEKSRPGAGLVRLLRLRLAGQIWLWRHGWQWPVVAWLLASGAAALYYGAGQVAAEARAAAELEQRLAALPAPAAAAEAPKAAASANATSRADLPADPLAMHRPFSEEVRRLYALANREHVAILQADFVDSQSGGDGHAALRRLEISLPTQTTYPQLRRFVEAALLELPNASLDSLSFKRNQVSSPLVDVEMHWSLWSTADAERRRP